MSAGHLRAIADFVHYGIKLEPGRAARRLFCSDGRSVLVEAANTTCFQSLSVVWGFVAPRRGQAGQPLRQRTVKMVNCPRRPRKAHINLRALFRPRRCRVTGRRDGARRATALTPSRMSEPEPIQTATNAAWRWTKARSSGFVACGRPPRSCDYSLSSRATWVGYRLSDRSMQPGPASPTFAIGALPRQRVPTVGL